MDYDPDVYKRQGVGFWGTLRAIFESDSWFYAFLYFILIIGFAYFYAAVQYDPMEISNNLKKNGGFIPGFRPGKPDVYKRQQLAWAPRASR